MPTMPPLHRPKTQRTKVERQREHDLRRGSARDRGYDAAWDRASAAFRREFPFCQYGEVGAFGEAHVAAADLVDHLYPQQQFPGVFWRRDLWVSCCAECHNGPKRALELKRDVAALHRLADQLGRPRLGG